MCLLLCGVIQWTAFFSPGNLLKISSASLQKIINGKGVCFVPTGRGLMTLSIASRFPTFLQAIRKEISLAVGCHQAALLGLLAWEEEEDTYKCGLIDCTDMKFSLMTSHHQEITGFPVNTGSSAITL